MTAPLLVHRARVTASAGTRGDVERWFGGVPVDALGLGRDELFYVPRLSMRVPARGASGASRMPDRILEALRRLLAGAESGWGRSFAPDRPYRFTSRGKYYAWLVRLHVHDGSAAARDAFHGATGHAALGPWQRATVLRDAPTLVGTIARLAEIGAAARWIARFEPADFTVAAEAMAARFGLRLETVGIRVPRVAPEPGKAPEPDTPRLERLVAQAAETLAAQGNDWRDLPLPGRMLLLAASALANAPARAAGRAEALAEAIAKYAAEPAVPAPRAPAALRVAPPIARSTPASIRSVTGLPPSAPVDARPGLASRTVARRRGAHSAAAKATLAVGARVSSRPFDTRAPLEAPFGPLPQPRRGIAAPAEPEPVLAPDLSFDTGHGGLLLLLNAFTALGLYPDFTEPLGRRLEPSPLWLADRIGRYWFGTAYARDPLARWVAANSAGGRLPGKWRTEADWLTGFETAAAPRAAAGALWHRAGFPLAADCSQRVRPDRRSLNPRVRRIARAPHRLPRAPADRWAACLALYLDARLRRRAGAGLDLLALPARVTLRDLDMRIAFRIDSYPVELRLAGLDRDPGWQPAEGRSFAFMFE